eukprot:TRINITY_DN6579_c0_g2_i3.p1 TRINITY_DN6579_c0_g2~~TRINITY_DN6579_c0_g2_i3.p1  ORF type:complete len:253 (+),score=46.92 TRINITY_DN6579_c0_g2_i3:244-1002(+)
MPVIYMVCITLLDVFDADKAAEVTPQTPQPPHKPSSESDSDVSAYGKTATTLRRRRKPTKTYCTRPIKPTFDDVAGDPDYKMTRKCGSKYNTKRVRALLAAFEDLPAPKAACLRERKQWEPSARNKPANIISVDIPLRMSDDINQVDEVDDDMPANVAPQDAQEPCETIGEVEKGRIELLHSQQPTPVPTLIDIGCMESSAEATDDEGGDDGFSPELAAAMGITFPSMQKSGTCSSHFADRNHLTPTSRVLD